MCGTAICAAVLVLGIDVGWQPLPDGGVEYIIQIEPEMLDTLRRGEDLGSDIPSNLDVRSYRITVGTGKLPRKGHDQSTGTRTGAKESKTKDLTARMFADPFFGSSASSRSPSDSFLFRTPGKLAPAPDSKPLGGRQVTFEEPAAEQKPTQTQPPGNTSPTQAPDKPWWPLTLALATLFGSLGGNVYLGWITWDTRSRYRVLLTKFLAGGQNTPDG